MDGTDFRIVVIVNTFHYLAHSTPNGNKYIRFCHSSGNNMSKRKFSLDVYTQDIFNYLTKTDEEFKRHIKQGEEEAV